MKCEACGTLLSEGAKFCRACGTPVRKVSDPPPTLAPTVIAPRPSDNLIGRVLAGRYRLLEKLGQGGMGVVYKAEHVEINRPAAVKILTPELANNPEFVTRFQREARLASQIEHRNALAIYDFGRAEGGLVYLAMELLNGEPLADIMKRQGTLPLEYVAQAVGQAAEALDAAHQIGIIHRDFKPDNVMVCRRAGRPDRVVVLDFGIAKQTRVEPEYEALTRTGMVLGTPRYMSPEQAADQPLNPRSDLYSLALVAYEMLTGVIPFSGATPQSQMVNRLIEDPLPLSRARPDLTLPPAVEPVIMRALSRDPNYRYASAGEFAEELQRAARPQPMAAPTQQVNAVPTAYAPSAAPTYPAPAPYPYAAGTSPALAAAQQISARSKAPIIVGVVLALVLPAIAAGIYIFSFRGLQHQRLQTPTPAQPQPTQPKPQSPPIEPPPGLTPEQVAASLNNAISGGRLVTLTGDDAYTYYSQLKTLDPGNRLLREVAPKVLPQLRRLGDEVFTRKAAVVPGEVSAEEWSRALRVYQWASELSPNDKALEARQQFAQGEVARSQDKPEEAERGYQAAAQIDPRWALPQNSLGRLRFEKKLYDEAIEYYNRAIELQPGWEIPYNNLGTTYFYKREYDTAVQWYEKAVELNPKWPRPHVWLGEVYERQKMKEEALAAYKKALDLDPHGDYIDVAVVKGRIAELQK